MKEIEVLREIDFPSICKAVGINTQEKLMISNDGFEDEEEEKEMKTTVALFIECLPFKLKDMWKARF